MILEAVVSDDGTAASAIVPGYGSAGTTGTAQRAAPGGGYTSGYTASFAGFASADVPRLALSVSIQGPMKGYYGGHVAAPLYSEIMRFALASMRVAPTGTAAPEPELRPND